MQHARDIEEAILMLRDAVELTTCPSVEVDLP